MYYSRDKIILVVNFPINQWVIIDTVKSVFYYPDKKEAIEISAKNSTPLSFLEDILNLLNETYGLEDAMMEISNTEVINDTLITTWEPIEKDTGFEFQLFFFDNKLMKSKLSNKRLDLMQTTYYNNYQDYDNIYLPNDIISVKSQEDYFSTNIYEYQDFNINNDLPDEIDNFELPLDTKLTKREW